MSSAPSDGGLGVESSSNLAETVAVGRPELVCAAETRQHNQAAIAAVSILKTTWADDTYCFAKPTIATSID
jgi:hypothetical protein